ncbi:PREDICTED: uncharacterized protein LOC106292209 [Brassica oleracea var. oleracea]|uniref:uncharacterized protein LOC106292209 n=1 Tax=Brassica oleracea var. oleracea TaxID=109376 RepID=UPI0006A6D97F|nr:PREDICTED: uncharacterized protein LOC106292209 [Brassica oleracea var. oleracea]
MVKTKFTRNGREVMIFGAMRNFDYGSDEAIQESKKGGERDASVSLSSPERSRIRKGVEGISMLASTEASKASKTRRGTSYGSPASSPEKTTRRGTSYGSPSPVKATRRGSTLSPRVAKKQKVNVASSGDDKEEWPETEMLASTVAKKTRRGTSYGGSPVSPRQSKKQKVNSEKSLGDDGDEREEFLQIVVNEEEEFGDIGDDGREDENGIAGIEEFGCTNLSLYFGDKAKNDDCEVDEDEGDDDDKILDHVSSDDENEEEMIPAQAYREDTDPEELLRLGKTFSDAEDFKHACLRYTLKTRYNIKYYRSSSLKMGAKCAAEMRDDEARCPWMVYCSYDRRKQKLMVKTYVNDHKCERTGYSKILKRSAIASLFAERLRLNPKLTAKEILSEILREDIETIPGATVGSKKRFYRLYMCFQAQKEAWKKTCRPVIGLDGAFLKWDIKGQLLAAVGRDGDNRIVPIAWAVVEIENDTNWDWFVKRLALDLGLENGNGFVIMSDKQKGLVKAVHTLLPEAEHRQCCRHIYESWRKGGKDLRLQRFFWFIARSYTTGMFNHNMDELKNYDPGAHASLIKTKPETWSRAFFKIGSYCNDNLNNLCESFNKTIGEPRKKPLLDMLEEIRCQCMTRNYNRSKMAKDRKTRFIQKTHKELDKVEKKSKECSLRWAIGPKTEVEDKDQSYVVNLENETCACRSWQMNGIPFIHAAKVILATQPISGVKPTVLGSDL